MSDFTIGTLFLAKDGPEIQEQLRQLTTPYRLESINDQWSAFFTPDEWLQEPAAVAVRKQISTVAPLLHFDNSEDHGWGFRLFCLGEQVAQYSRDYDRGTRKLMGELQALRLFGVDDLAIRRVRKLLTGPVSWEEPWGQVEDFKTMLGFEEMDWLSYEYLSDDEDNVS